MPVKIKEVVSGSLAKKHGITPADTLISINGNDIIDVLDYRFYLSETTVELVLSDALSQVRTVSIKKPEYDDIGLEFETYLMDNQKFCKNKCVFCFVDQNPPGMREPIYFKDDDDRLGFLFGNYITLTNTTDREIERIIAMKLSPVNISVHTTNPELRVELMGNRTSGTALSRLFRLGEAGIAINAQLVLCPNLNDGDELANTFRDLAKIPSIQSIACVPVGLTAHREGLYPLTPFNKESAGAVIDTIERQNATGSARNIYPSDEFFITAERPIPELSYFGDLLQLENGVGMTALLCDEFTAALEDVEPVDRKRTISVGTGEIAYPFIKKLCDMAMQKDSNLTVNVYKLKNHFFGGHVTVTGLLTGSDIVSGLEGCILGEKLLLAETVLRAEKDLTLDDMTVEEISNALGVAVHTVQVDGYALVEELFE